MSRTKHKCSDKKANEYAKFSVGFLPSVEWQEGEWQLWSLPYQEHPISVRYCPVCGKDLWKIKKPKAVNA